MTFKSEVINWIKNCKECKREVDPKEREIIEEAKEWNRKRERERKGVRKGVRNQEIDRNQKDKNVSAKKKQLERITTLSSTVEHGG